MDTAKRYGLLAVKLLLALAFVAAGAQKLIGTEMMVGVFEMIGLGQWFRYLTALIEIGGAALLFVPGLQALGAGLLVCTMVGAVIAHLTVLGPSLVPALILGILAAIVLYAHRDQITARLAA